MEDKHVKTVMAFAKDLIDEVRNETIEVEEITLNRPFGGETTKQMYEEAKSFTDKQKETLMKFVYDSIDSTIFHFFRMLDEHDEYDLVIRKGKKEVLSIKEISDGVYGDIVGLITEENYGKYPMIYKEFYE